MDTIPCVKTEAILGRNSRCIWCVSVALALSSLGFESVAAADDSEMAIRSATSRGVALVTRAASNWQRNKTCFSCHHQTLPMLAMVEACKTNEQIVLDHEWLRSQADTTQSYFDERVDDMRKGRHVPGGAATVGFGFWALSLDARVPNDTTSAMTEYLLQIQGVARIESTSAKASVPDGRWVASCRRAPMQASPIGDTVLVLIGMNRFANAGQAARIAKSVKEAEAYLWTAKLVSTQDRLWRLWGLSQLQGDRDELQRVRTIVLKSQREDGGWSQQDSDQASDAYSTGQAVYMLCKSGTPTDATEIERARDYLIRTQHEDGSWLVESRVKNKAQVYFENGDPHGEHQFLSTAATCWGIAALSILLPLKPQ